jgi:hypothetical protein
MASPHGAGLPARFVELFTSSLESPHYLQKSLDGAALNCMQQVVCWIDR